MPPTSQQRNGEIELVRILMAFIIVNYHSYLWDGDGCRVLFRNGYIGVELFFLLSGFLMASSIARKREMSTPSIEKINRETFLFLRHKLASFWPELFLACSLGLFVFALLHYPDIRLIADMVRDTFSSEMLLLDMTGLAGVGINGCVWYLSSMLLGLALLYPLFRRAGSSPLLLVILLLTLGCVYRVGSPAVGLRGGGLMYWFGFTWKANLRAFCELGIGAFLYPLALSLARVKLNRWARWCLLLLKLSCYILIVAYARKAMPGYPPLVLVAMATVIVLSFARICPDADIYQHRAIFWLGRFSLPLYLSHQVYSQNLGVLIPAGEWSGNSKLLLYNACSFATALLVMYLSGLVRRFFREHPNFFLKNPVQE